MNSNLRLKFLAGIVVFLLTAMLFPALAGAITPGTCVPDKGFGRKRHQVSPFGVWRNLKMVQELGLTDKQVEGLREADFALREKHLELKSRLDGLHLQLEKLFSQDPVNTSAVLHLAQKISDLKGKLYVQKIESRLAVGKLLNPDQLKQLQTFEWYRHARPGQKNRKGNYCRHLYKLETID